MKILNAQRNASGMLTAIIYIRVSTDEQADKGYSLRHQEETLRKYCELNNIRMLEVVKEDYSAKTFIRPAFQVLLKNIRNRKLKPDLLIFTKWDRFSRNAPDAYGMISTLTNLGVEPQAIEQPIDVTIPENKIMLAFYLSAPEVENDRRALNTLVGMRRARKEGRWITTAPRGYDNRTDDRGRKVIVLNKYAPIMKWVFEMLATGHYELEELRRMCIKKGYDFKRSQFYVCFRNPVYCGRIVVPAYKNEEEYIIKGNHEPLISEELFDKVQLMLTKNRVKKNRKACIHEELPLRGFLNCPRCGKRLQGSGSTGGSGLKHFYYHCQNGCKERVKAHTVNVAFSDYLTTFKFKKTVQEMYEQVLQDVFRNNNADKAVDKKTQQDEFEKNKKRLDNARKMMLDGEMDRAEYIEIKNLIEPKLNEILNENVDSSQMQIELRGYLKNGLNAIQNLGHLFDRADIQGKQDIIRSILKENAIFSNGRTRTAKLNHLVELITYADGQHKGGKKQKESKNCSLSGKVAGTRLEPMSAFLADKSHLMS